jgi:hypothetical protein
MNLERGETFFSHAEKPIISFDANFVWIGNNENRSMFCFATLTEPDEIRELRDELTDLLRRIRRIESKR